MPVVVQYRMPYIGTVAVNDRDGSVLVSKRFAATVEEGPAEMMERLAAEVTRLCELPPALPVVVVQDGAPELHRLIDEWSENFHIPIAMRLIDRFHVDERLAGAAEILEPDRVKRWALEATWRRSIARSDLAIARICDSFRRLVRDVWHADDGDDGGEDFFPRPPKSVASMHGPAAQILDGHVTYFDNASGRFACASARAQGFPIGSGVTEGACKSVVTARCKGSGQRWHKSGLSPCLLARTLYLNDRLHGCIDLLLEQDRRQLVAA